MIRDMENIKYAPTHCESTGKAQGEYRYYLEQIGDKMLFIIGLNPSTANENICDRTMGRVLSFVQNTGYNGFVMLNLYPQRQTDKYALPKEQDEAIHQKSLQYIRELGEKYPTADILLAFGNGITLRSYLKKNLGDIIETLGARKYLQIGILTAKGFPRHPLYAANSFSLVSCNIEKFKK